MNLPAGLATIASRWDDTPHARGAVDMAQRLSREQALTDLMQADAFLIDTQGPMDGVKAVAAVRLDRAITDHAALVISGGYRTQDKRDDDRL